MTITIKLAPHEEAWLREQAALKNKDLSEVVVEAVRAYGLASLPPSSRIPERYDPQAAIDALDAFLEGDEQEQRETYAFLEKAVDEDRPGQRRIFGQGFNPPANAK